jgi:hypothetical protein
MRDNRVQVCLLLAIVASIAVVIALLPSRSTRRVTQEQFERLKAGMTQAEAESVIGGAPQNNLRYPAIIWLPQATCKRTSREIAPVSPAIEFFSQEDKPKGLRQGATIPSALDFFPQVAAKNGHQVIWIESTGLIAVYFGPEGRLQHKYHSTVHGPGRPSVIDWIASRPRMIGRSLGF